tara:strand:- start:618 stop:1013 length:396 start_codon:yes stop_codon:yes gene_type:complete
MESKYLYFNNAGTNGQIDAADDVVCYRASDFRGAVQNGTTRTEITLLFAPMFGELEVGSDLGANVSDTVVLTITTDKHKEVLTAIIDAINAPIIAGGPGKGLIVVADDMNLKYLTSDISGTVNVTQTPAAA